MGITVGQRVSAEKLARAREMRRRGTVEEQRLWRALRRPFWNGSPFRRQQVLDGFVVDFYCHAAGVVVELDGAVHHVQEAYDSERDKVLTSRGLRLLRIPDSDVTGDLAGVLARIRAACEPEKQASGRETAHRRHGVRK